MVSTAIIDGQVYATVEMPDRSEVRERIRREHLQAYRWMLTQVKPEDVQAIKDRIADLEQR